MAYGVLHNKRHKTYNEVCRFCFNRQVCVLRKALIHLHIKNVKITPSFWDNEEINIHALN